MRAGARQTIDRARDVHGLLLVHRAVRAVAALDLQALAQSVGFLRV